MKNRLNDLDSKAYMKFLKSWFLFQDNSADDFIRFFCKELDEDGRKMQVGLWGFDHKQLKELNSNKRIFVDLQAPIASGPLGYALFDLRTVPLAGPDQTLLFFREKLLPLLPQLRKHIRHRAYISFFIPFQGNDSEFFPVAWQLGQWIGEWFEMKDEKIGCCEQSAPLLPFFPLMGSQVIYALNFRNTLEGTPGEIQIYYPQSTVFKSNKLHSWFILKPPRRKEKVKLHPAKFPEVLISQLIQTYSETDDIVFDPMAGTGSSLLAAMENGRKAFGCEITSHFAQIAIERLRMQKNEQGANCPEAWLIQDDAYNFDRHTECPKQFDYMVTSPPYWDMLNMKGAETQRYRRQKGLKVNYSDLDSDLGNCADYNIFLAKLLRIYHKTSQRLKPGGMFTIIVKNIKKKGVIYPFAWDLAEALSETFDIATVQFWLQDDIRLAPYGYGNAWVSNTFHHYCLTLRKR